MKTDKKRVGLIVMSTPNYGNNLVNMAAFHILENLGYKVTIIFPPKDSERIVRWESKYFSERNYPCSNSITPETYPELLKLNDFFDIFVIGGDQLFRYRFSDMTSHFFSLDWVDSKKMKISVGTSFGEEIYENTGRYFVESCSYWLGRFTGISVRESTGLNILDNLFRLQVPDVKIVDSVLLCDEDYIKSLTSESEVSDSFVAAYILDSSEKSHQLVQNVSDIYFHGNKKIICDLNKENQYLESVHIDAKGLVTGEDWLSMIANCEYFFTDSFHGICMALIFHKQFSVIAPDAQRGMTRIYEILNEFGLRSRIVQDYDDFLERHLFENKIDFASIEQSIKKKRQFGREWITHILSLPPAGDNDKFWKIYIRKAWKFVGLADKKNICFVAWGAGAIFKHYLPALRKRGVHWVCDIKPEVWGREIVDGIWGISEQELLQIENVVVLITIDSWTATMDIFRRLENRDNIRGIMNVLEIRENEL